MTNDLELKQMPGAEPSTVHLREVRAGEDMTAFRTLNEEWISMYFTLEARDREVLEDPATHILALGGHIYLAELAGEKVGCVALIPQKDDAGVCELSKMAVSPEVRGQGIGRMLLEYAIAEGRRAGVRMLFLGSNRRLANAVHLYESVGFRHVAQEGSPALGYSRADVFMNLAL